MNSPEQGHSSTPLSKVLILSGLQSQFPDAHVSLPLCSSAAKQISTVAASSDGALLELHDVLCQSSRLVGEDVLDLTELLVQGGGSSLHRGKK